MTVKERAKRLGKWLAENFSLARLVMGVVLATLAFAVYGHIRSQQIRDEYQLRPMRAEDLRPQVPEPR